MGSILLQPNILAPAEILGVLSSSFPDNDQVRFDIERLQAAEDPGDLRPVFEAT
jgi:hypothetical protein